ncbi:MAG: integrase core domain-containing protein, partial [Mariniphaga sp.]|nr:integrase core domain-containing protein [Mariniphaga sp.]
MDCTLYSGFKCTLYDGMSPLIPPPPTQKKEKTIKKIVHYIPNSPVHYVPDSVVHYIPKYSDNAYIEAFHSIMERELVSRYEFESFHHADMKIAQYIFTYNHI